MWNRRILAKKYYVPSIFLLVQLVPCGYILPALSRAPTIILSTDYHRGHDRNCWHRQTSRASTDPLATKTIEGNNIPTGRFCLYKFRRMVDCSVRIGRSFAINRHFCLQCVGRWFVAFISSFHPSHRVHCRSRS